MKVRQNVHKMLENGETNSMHITLHQSRVNYFQKRWPRWVNCPRFADKKRCAYLLLCCDIWCPSAELRSSWPRCPGDSSKGRPLKRCKWVLMTRPGSDDVTWPWDVTGKRADLGIPLRSTENPVCGNGAIHPHFRACFSGETGAYLYNN